ncbi:hypothetical protein K449DRAFT_398640 [Hypoxylon sp. EC38]|nr:hypothetical protein K449DRAFT_398640 [Hypoxylon sp. EC38]
MTVSMQAPDLQCRDDEKKESGRTDGLWAFKEPRILDSDSVVLWSAITLEGTPGIYIGVLTVWRDRLIIKMRFGAAGCIISDLERQEVLVDRFISLTFTYNVPLIHEHVSWFVMLCVKVKNGSGGYPYR